MSSKGITAAMSGMRTVEDVTGNVGINLSNANTPGFKEFDAFLISTTNKYNGGVTSKSAINTDKQGEILKTEKEFDYAIEGRGFFPVECNGEKRFTAAGGFNPDNDGYLRGVNGCYLLAGNYISGETIRKTSIEKDSANFGKVKIPVGDLIKGTATSTVDAKVVLSAEQLAVGGGTIKITAPTGAGNSFTMTFYQKKGDNDVTSKILTFQMDGAATSAIIPGAIQYTNQADFETKLESNAGIYFDSVTGGSGAKEFALHGSLNNNVRLKFDITSAGGAMMPSIEEYANGAFGTPFTPTLGSFISSPYNAADPANNMTGGKYKADFEDEFPIYDSLGGKHVAFAAFKKTDVDKYTVEIYTKTQVNGNKTPIAAGVVSFDSQGKMFGVPVAFSGVTSPINIADSLKFTWDPGRTKADPTELKINWEKMEMFGKNNLGDFDSNGNTPGTLSSTSVDQYGNIVGSYTNGMQQFIAAVPVVTFKNPEKLENESGTVFLETADSGAAKYNVSGNQGVGKVVGGNISSSNADSTENMTLLMRMQRLYSYNAKAYGMMNRMEDDLLNVIRV